MIRRDTVRALMPVMGSDIDLGLGPLLATAREGLEPGAWFDAHTHMGHNDPDGRAATPEEILGGLDAAGQQRALLFAMHEPDGYSGANDAVLEACAASGGRLLPLARISPNAEGAVGEARRTLEAGALGFKLHPRSDAFGLPHPVVEELIALAHERRAPVLFHAGRGIPHLGESVIDYARRHPGARLILAHAGISDLGWIAPHAAALPNLFFDTAWWQIADQLQLYSTVPPGNILYASDMPYAPGVMAAFLFRRCAAAVGLGEEAVRSIAGGQVARVVAGEEPLDVGPPPGLGALGERLLEGERVATYCAVAAQLGYRGFDPVEALQLARTACQTPRTDVVGEVLGLCATALERSLAALAEQPERPMLAMPGALVASALAGTIAVGAPDVAL